MSYTIYNPNELFHFIDASLKPNQNKKEQNCEVFTPIHNDSIWTNPNLKWLDPAAGIGNFAIVVYYRLMDGLKTIIPYDDDRRSHILQNMLYMVEYDKSNSVTMNSIFCGKINIFTGSFIDGKKYEGIDVFSIDDTHIMDDTNIQFSRKVKSFGGKFDVIMGNPPYNSGGISSKILIKEKQSGLYSSKTLSNI